MLNVGRHAVEEVIFSVRAAPHCKGRAAAGCCWLRSGTTPTDGQTGQLMDFMSLVLRLVRPNVSFAQL